MLLFSWPGAARLQEAEPGDELSEARGRFDGAWRMVQSAREGQRLIDRAIDQAISPMNYFIRPLARSRLREGTHLNRRIELRFDEGNRLTVRFEDRDSYTTRIGRTERRRNESGEAMRVTQRIRPSGQLEQVFETDSGTRWYVYTPSAEGRMRIETTTNGPRMPRPMHFALDYRRE